MFFIYLNLFKGMCVCVCVCVYVCVYVCVCVCVDRFQDFFSFLFSDFFLALFPQGQQRSWLLRCCLLEGFYCPTKVFDLLCCLLLLLEALLPRSKKWNLFKGFKPFYTGVLIVDGALKLSQNYSNYCYVLSVSSLL